MEKGEITQKLNAMECRVHSRPAVVTLTTFGSNTKVTIDNACCKEFEQQVSNRAADLIAEASADDFMDNMKF